MQGEKEEEEEGRGWRRRTLVHLRGGVAFETRRGVHADRPFEGRLHPWVITVVPIKETLPDVAFARQPTEVHLGKGGG